MRWLGVNIKCSRHRDCMFDVGDRAYIMFVRMIDTTDGDFCSYEEGISADVAS